MAGRKRKVPDFKDYTFQLGGLYLEVMDSGWRVGQLVNGEQRGGGKPWGEVHFPGSIPVRVRAGEPPLTNFICLGQEADLEFIERVVEAWREAEEAA